MQCDNDWNILIQPLSFFDINPSNVFDELLETMKTVDSILTENQADKDNALVLYCHVKQKASQKNNIL